jgi:hypothetical protein
MDAYRMSTKGGGLINAKQIGESASAGKHNAADGEKFTALNAPINAGLELIRFLHLFSPSLLVVVERRRPN